MYFDQNTVMTSAENPEDQNQHPQYFKSPLHLRPSQDSRFCFSEAKTIPFKNTTNDTNLPQPTFASEKKTGLALGTSIGKSQGI